jgi:nicotinamidase-related amidase
MRPLRRQQDDEMTLPKTLRDVSGLGTELPTLRGSALILIDLQNTYRQGVMKLVDVEPAILEAQALLRRARQTGIPIFHIQHDAGAGSPYDVRENIGAISDEVAPVEGETLIVKGYPNAFIGTDLLEKLEATGCKDVVLAGFMTHMCINSTARGAFNLGFRPTVVAAATATRDLPNVDGSVVPAAAIQAASLAAVADLFAVVTARESDLKA